MVEFANNFDINTIVLILLQVNVKISLFLSKTVDYYLT